ncbi:MAG: aminopeptidase N, partial [Actinomycetes bacterium]
YLYTQFETAEAKRMYACFDQPDLKATFTFTVVVPEHWEVVSNGPAEKVEPIPGVPANRVYFRTTKPMPTYVTALVAGPYHRVADWHDGIDLGVWCRRTLAAHLDADAILQVTKQGFDWFHERFGYRYPFDKYDQLFVPEFNAGAMENAGCVTFTEDYVFRSKVTDASYERRAETILHELAHMWFGDLVTMRWWDDLWLNESFATYASVLCQSEVTRWRAAWTTFANVEKTWAYRQDQLPSTHPVFADIRDIEDVEVNFDGITYAKGASVLKQLVAWVGRDEFFAGLRRYFRAHEWGNTTLRDLLGILEQTSSRDLSAWSKEWLETAGVNTLRPDFTLDGSGAYSGFAVLQEATDEHPTLRSHRIAIGLYDRVDGRLVRRERVELDVTGARTEVPQLVGQAQPDLVLLNDEDLTYAKLRLDERSLATLTRAIGEFTDSLPRTLCWSAAWDMCRDAEMPARDYLTLVLSGLEVESDISVVQMLLRQVKSALDMYATPGFRPEGYARLAAHLRRLLAEAEPGSDAQLTFVRAFTSAATSREDVEFVRGLLDGSQVVDGLAVDADLRWHLLVKLVSRGAADEAAIDAELDRDNTATGQRHAVTALASRPTEQAKTEAWTAVVERDELPNALQSATIAGFVQPDQRDLLRRFTDRYFDAVIDVWTTRSNEMAQNIAIGLYPALLVEPATLQRTDRFLEEADPPPALRRLVLEGRAGVERALRAQTCDRAAADEAG